MERRGMKHEKRMNITLLCGVLPSCESFIVFNDKFLLETKAILRSSSALLREQDFRGEIKGSISFKCLHF